VRSGKRTTVLVASRFEVYTQGNWIAEEHSFIKYIFHHLLCDQHIPPWARIKNSSHFLCFQHRSNRKIQASNEPWFLYQLFWNHSIECKDSHSWHWDCPVVVLVQYVAQSYNVNKQLAWPGILRRICLHSAGA